MAQRPEGYEMTYRDSVLGENALKFEPHSRHRLPVPVSPRSCKYSKREFGYLKHRKCQAQKSKDESE
jgi:hypothetical protein